MEGGRALPKPSILLTGCIIFSFMAMVTSLCTHLMQAGRVALSF